MTAGSSAMTGGKRAGPALSAHGLGKRFGDRVCLPGRLL
jgi:hypothetical protein